MAIDSKHPLYSSRQPDWRQMQHTYSGERQVKAQTTEYLPPTEGMEIDGMKDGQEGKKSYDSYLKRAVFPDFVRQGIEAMVGIMHREEARVEVPARLAERLKDIGANGESVQMFLRRMNEYQLLYGRAGILVEAPSGQGPDAMPYLVLYPATRIINWDDGPRIQGRQALEFVVIDESDYERVGDLEWRLENRWRICAMSGTVGTLREEEQEPNTAGGVYQVAKVETTDAELTADSWITPQIGGRTLNRVPFIFVNTKDMASNPDDPPLLGLSNLCLAIYRGEADYRQCLHMQGQETLVVSGAESDSTAAGNKTRLGVGAKIELPREGDAKFIGISAGGLSEMKAAITDDKMLAQEMTSRLFDSTGTSYQSGEALKIRVSAKTATLRTVATTSAAALAEALRIMAEWIGANPEEVLVEPNTDFADTTTASRTALELMQARQVGFPISKKSLHRFAVQQGLSVMTFEDEMAEIDGEEPDVLPQGAGGAAGGILGRATGGSRVPRGEPDDSE